MFLNYNHLSCTLYSDNKILNFVLFFEKELPIQYTYRLPTQLHSDCQIAFHNENLCLIILTLLSFHPNDFDD